MKSLKVRLELTDKQQTLARKHAGTARFAYNWGLHKAQAMLAQGGKRPSAIDLHKLWVSEVKAVHSWTYQVSKCAPQQALRNLEQAFQRTFKVRRKRLAQVQKERPQR